MARLIAVLPGDGIGPEVTAAAVTVLETVNRSDGLGLDFVEGQIGGAAIDASGDPLPAATEDLCRQSSAVLLGAVGGPKWSDPANTVRPEQGLLRLRKALGLFCNLRPVRTHPALEHASPLKSELLAGVDILVVRELTGGIYFGKKERHADYAIDECRYERQEIERVVRAAATLAMGRQQRLTSVDTSNVLETSRLWREVVDGICAEEYPDLQVEHLLVDAAAMHLLSRPASFDVLVTENLFGDILTDEASMLAGSLGLLPSASLGDPSLQATDGVVGLYEPIHGSAPDIAGQGIANPCGTILSTAMMLRHSLNEPAAAAHIEAAVHRALDNGARTADISTDTPLNTTAMTRAILSQL
jgi:3-isopropylmalate dehydrogenase